jgi:hypothetical protein
MILDEEEAKAIQEAAKVAGKAVDLVNSSGSFLNRVFGPLIEDSVGLVADKIKFYRKVNFLAFQQKVQNICDERNIAEMSPLPPKLALSLIEAATLEDDPSLQNMYANLMANALDTAYKGDIVPAFVSVVREFTPFDALFLTKLYTFSRRDKWHACDLRHLKWRKHLGIDDERNYDNVNDDNKKSDLYPVTIKENFTIDNLSRLGCVRRSEPYYMPIPEITIFGVSLIEACTSEG